MQLEVTIDGRLLRVEVRRQDGGYTVIVDGREHQVDYVEAGRFASLLVAGRSVDVGFERRNGGYVVSLPGRCLEAQVQDAARGVSLGGHAAHGPTRVNAPMPGKVVRVLVAVGDVVEPGQGLVVMEAMKMENELRAPRGGSVREIRVAEGQAVETGAPLVVVE